MKKILIVDDDHTIVDLLMSALSTEDRSIRFVYDGEAATKRVAKEVFDLIICDLMLPKGHGYQVIAAVRANPEASRTKILVLTAKAFRHDLEKARELGADLVLSKPFELADLQTKVDQILS